MRQLIERSGHRFGDSAREALRNARPLYDGHMPDSDAVRAWVRRNEAARAEDRRRDAERSMADLLAEAVRLSRVASELEENLRGTPDVRSR
jgi:hypothetical protein